MNGWIKAEEKNQNEYTSSHFVMERSGAITEKEGRGGKSICEREGHEEISVVAYA